MLFPTGCIRLLPVAGAGDEAFSGVVGEAEGGVDWLRGPPEAVFKLLENENIVELAWPPLLVGDEASTAENLQKTQGIFQIWTSPGCFSPSKNEPLSSNKWTTPGISNNLCSRYKITSAAAQMVGRHLQGYFWICGTTKSATIDLVSKN